MISFPNAKINIGLHIVSKRDDGYHNLETLFYPVKLADVLEMVPSEVTELSCSGNPIDGDLQNNLVLKAWRILEEEFNLPPVRIHLHKVIPTGAGLGGGSSDAASVFTMANDLFQLNLATDLLKELAGRIGADCPFFIENKPAFATGIGDVLEHFPLQLSGYHVLIIKPPFSISTPEAYREVIPSTPGFNLRELETLDLENWKNTVVNDFEASIFKRFPQLKDIKQSLYKMGAVYASLSGSGSALFGIFRHLPTNSEKHLPKGVSVYR